MSKKNKKTKHRRVRSEQLVDGTATIVPTMARIGDTLLHYVAYSTGEKVPSAMGDHLGDKDYEAVFSLTARTAEELLNMSADELHEHYTKWERVLEAVTAYVGCLDAQLKAPVN